MERLRHHEYNSNIESMRGLSISLVLSFHWFGFPRQGGALGVGLFFCISGYLITSILIEEYNQVERIDFKKFYTRRIRRLIPLAYLTLMLTLLIFLIVPSKSETSIDRQWLVSSVFFCVLYIGNLYGFANPGYADLAYPVSHFWSLAVEEQFYLAWPLVLLFLLKKARKHIIIYVSAVIFLAVSLHSFFFLINKSVWTLPISYLDVLCAGSLLAIIKFEYRYVFGTKLKTLFLFFCVSGLSCIFLTNLNNLTFFGQGSSLFALTEVSLFVTLFYSKIGRIRSLEFIGRYSYSLYCIHFPVLTISEYFWDNSWPQLFLSILLTFILSYLSQKYFESLFWKSRFHIKA